MARLNSKVICKEYWYYFFLFLRNEDTEMSAYLMSHSYSDFKIAEPKFAEKVNENEETYIEAIFEIVFNTSC